MAVRTRAPHFLNPRSTVCTNAPTIKAGSLFNRLLRPRVMSYTWCSLHTATFIVVTVTSTLPTTSVQLLLSDAYLSILDQIATGGSPGPILGGSFLRISGFSQGGRQSGAAVSAAYREQITYVVLAAAVQALSNFIHTTDTCGDATFEVWDGANPGRKWELEDIVAAGDPMEPEMV
ncbi:hypothetical protein MMC08_006063 [Hypocenomyce scalaris]|nr:hypothetical protein [Hypocenomyce scalaris]